MTFKRTVGRKKDGEESAEQPASEADLEHDCLEAAAGSDDFKSSSWPDEVLSQLRWAKIFMTVLQDCDELVDVLSSTEIHEAHLRVERIPIHFVFTNPDKCNDDKMEVFHLWT